MNALARIPDPEARAVLGAHLADLLGLVLDVQGEAALVCSRAHAAWHEAAHAVQYRAEGQRVRSVAVFRRGADWLGRTDAGRPWTAGPASDPAADLAQARILLAGGLAEWLHVRPLALGAGLDEFVLASGVIGIAAAKLGLDPEELTRRTVAETLAALRRHGPVLAALAGALLRRPKLKQVALARLLRPVVGCPPSMTPMETPR